LSTGLLPSLPDLLTPLVLPRSNVFSIGCEVGGMTILGAAPDSPILEILLRDAKSAGLTVWLPFSGRGLTGLMTPDVVVLGVGGRGLRPLGTAL